jgi:hypothetical protein
MATRVVGKLDSWSDGDLGGSSFMTLDEGENPVRLISSPYQFYIHWTKDTAGQNRKVRCALEGCPLCQRSEKPVARWYVSVLNRKTGNPAILEIGPQIFKQILALSKKDKWGNPRAYDLDITRQPKGSQPLYVVQPLPKEDLTKDEKKLCKAFIDELDLGAMTEASTPEEINERLGFSSASSPASSGKEVSDDFGSDDDDSDDWFDDDDA